MESYSFPKHYPKNCPPEPYDDKCGKYFRLIKNNDKLDPEHFKSHFETKQRIDLEDKKPCSRRAVSMFEDFEDAIKLSKLYPAKGKYVACLNLTGGHGVVCEEKAFAFKSHHNWWVPSGINACNFCTNVEGPIS